MSDDRDNVIQLFSEEPADRVKRLMVEEWEVAFNAAGQSLTAKGTATSLRVAASVMDRLIQGACAVGDITEEQRDSLRWWIGTGLHAADELQTSA
jgi:hypothetical protein